MTKIAFLGLGVMGYPMAGHLANAGYDITVYNRTNSKAKNGFQNSLVTWKTPLQRLLKMLIL